ncbi:GNAT family N-acetyltransferase [Pseudomonas sp.]|uniref:GNAT family N-acetyltransferase n=1 Tax=Pseudomonas sp. TaxID=306 RepID=UPI003BB78360
MEVHINKAELTNLQGVAELFDAYRVFYGKKPDLTLARDFITERLENSESTIFYAQTADGKYVGFTQLYPSFSSVSAQRSWILNDLYVSEKVRGKGIGKKLLSKAKEYAIITKAKGISLETARSNIQAQKLYESLGYIKDLDYYSYYLSLNKA